MTSPIIAGDALARGVRNTFINQWQKRFEGVQQKLGAVMEFGIPSDKFEELYGHFEVAPYARRRPWNQAVEAVPFRARNFAVQNLAWDIAVQWKKEHRLFDQLRDIERAARRSGENYGTLNERVFYQIITGGTDALLLEVLPSAPDGAAMFSATKGDATDRFEVSGGNIITGTGVASSDAIRDDFFNALERIFRFQDPQGQPALDVGAQDAGVTVTFDVRNWKVFAEAFVQTRQVEGSATPTNVILESGMKVALLPTQRITDDDWPVFINDFDPRPVFEQVHTALEEHVQVEENSDTARRTKEEGIFWEEIKGYGINAPLPCCRVDN